MTSVQEPAKEAAQQLAHGGAAERLRGCGAEGQRDEPRGRMLGDAVVDVPPGAEG